MSTSKHNSIVPHNQVVRVADLAPEKDLCTVVVRVLRKWEVYTARGGDKPMSVQLVFVDKEGSKIQAHIDKPYIYKHGGCLIEGSVYNVSTFSVGTNYGEFRAATHPYRINIKYNTEIRRVSPDEVETPPYEFTPPADCFEKSFNKNYLVDVAGVFIGLGRESEFQTTTGKSTRLPIDLENRGFRFGVTLFGEHATAMKDFLHGGGVTGDVVVILFCKINVWPGGTTLQTAGNTTRMLFNPDIPETLMLRETTSKAIIPTQLTITQSGNSDSARESFLEISQKYTLTDIKLAVDVKDFVATATIDYIFEDLPWWYYACRVCSRKCKDDEDLPNLYYCPGCDKHVDKVVRKFLLKLLLVDETDALTVVLFDNTVRALIGRQAEDVFRTWKADPNQGNQPTEVEGLRGRTALWRIQAEQKDGDRYPRSYRVRTVSEDVQLIKAYNDKWASEGTIDGGSNVLLIEDTPSSGIARSMKGTGVVSQDLNEKFEQTASNSSHVSATAEIVDITADNNDTPPAKRRALMDPASASSKITSQNIKVEK